MTPISFFATTALLGLFTVGASFVFNYNYVKERDPDCAEEQCVLLQDTLRGIAVASILLLGVQLVAIPVYLASLANLGPAAVETARMLDAGLHATADSGTDLAVRRRRRSGAIPLPERCRPRNGNRP